MIQPNEIPSGNRGINKEGRTLGEICQHPFPQSLYEAVDAANVSEETKRLVRQDMEATGSDAVPQWQGDQIKFDDVAVPGVRVSLPKGEQELLSGVSRLFSRSIARKELTPRMVRDLSYELMRSALAERWKCTLPQAGRLIGLIDLVIHEDWDGYAILVPNNVHNYKQRYAHRGYVSRMLEEMGKGVVDDYE